MNRIQLLDLLRKELVRFFDEMIELLPEERDFIVFRFFINDQVIMTDVVDYIYRVLLPIETKVKNRDEAYFKENAIMFEKLRDHDSKVNYFKELWERTDDAENKEVVWAWIEYFINIGKKYYSLG